MKTHKISKSDYKKAMAFRKKYKFWNPMMTYAPTVCGTEPLRVSWNWDEIDCKRCNAIKKNLEA